MTIKETISSIQEFLNRGVASDDKRYSDPFVYYQANIVRSRLIKQKKDKGQDVSPFSYQTLECFPLEWKPLYDCPCFNVECKVLISKYELPKILGYRNGVLVDMIRTLSGQKIDPISIPEAEYNSFSRTKADSLGWFVHRNKLVIVGSSTLRVVTVRALFADPIELATIPVCDDCGDPTPTMCFDPKMDDYPIDEEMMDTLEEMVITKIKKLGDTSPEDDENDADNTDSAIRRSAARQPEQ